MSEADLFVILDNVKFRKNYFQNRNRFLNRSGAEEWFTVPVKSGANSLNINEVKTVEGDHWRIKIEKQIKFNLGIDVQRVYEGTDNLLEINMRSILMSRDNFKISTPMVFASELGVQGTKSDLLVDICRATKATCYISGPSGKDYLDESLFKKEGIEIQYFSPKVLNSMSSIYNFSKR